MSVVVFTKQDASTVSLDAHPNSIEVHRVDTDIRTTAEDGFVVTRARTTVNRWVYTLTFNNRAQSVADLVQALEADVGCRDWFTWSPPSDFDSADKDVRFAEPVQYARGPLYVSMTVTLVTT